MLKPPAPLPKDLHPEPGSWADADTGLLHSAKRDKKQKPNQEPNQAAAFAAHTDTSAAASLESKLRKSLFVRSKAGSDQLHIPAEEGQPGLTSVHVQRRTCEETPERWGTGAVLPAAGHGDHLGWEESVQMASAPVTRPAPPALAVCCLQTEIWMLLHLVTFSAGLHWDSLGAEQEAMTKFLLHPKIPVQAGAEPVPGAGAAAPHLRELRDTCPPFLQLPKQEEKKRKNRKEEKTLEKVNEEHEGAVSVPAVGVGCHRATMSCSLPAALIDR